MYTLDYINTFKGKYSKPIMPEKEIMVVSREKLFRGQVFQGFQKSGRIDYEARVLHDYEWMERETAEQTPEFKQPIAYTLIINPTLRQVFAYQRAKQDEKYKEKRLQGKWSWGVGGHINRSDISLGSKNPIRESFFRELEEEVGVRRTRDEAILILGYINDDRDSVGSVHFGILYGLITELTKIHPKDQEIAEGRLRTLDELETICSNPSFTVENWSQIALEPLRTILRLNRIQENHRSWGIFCN